MNDKTSLEWASQLHEDELLKIVANTGRREVELEAVESKRVDSETAIHLMEVGAYLHNVGSEKSVDHLGHKLLPKAIDGDVSYDTWPDYWRNLKNEFKVFICTPDKKYADLRKKLSASAIKSHTAIVSTIAAAMAAQFGVVAGVLVPFVAMCLVVLTRTGKEAFCTTLEWDMPLKPKAKTESKNG